MNGGAVRLERSPLKEAMDWKTMEEPCQFCYSAKIFGRQERRGEGEGAEPESYLQERSPALRRLRVLCHDYCLGV